MAEKFQAMVMIGQANSRLKDYYDLWLLARSYEFDPDRLADAIAATFKQRGTAIPTDIPDGLRPEFYEDRAKRAQWRAFIEDVAVDPNTIGEAHSASETIELVAPKKEAEIAWMAEGETNPIRLRWLVNNAIRARSSRALAVVDLKDAKFDVRVQANSKAAHLVEALARDCVREFYSLSELVR